MKKFIGKIDNLPEAILILEMYDLWFDHKEKKAGSFKKTANGYELYMSATELFMKKWNK